MLSENISELYRAFSKYLETGMMIDAEGVVQICSELLSMKDDALVLESGVFIAPSPTTSSPYETGGSNAA